MSELPVLVLTDAELLPATKMMLDEGELAGIIFVGDEIDGRLVVSLLVGRGEGALERLNELEQIIRDANAGKTVTRLEKVAAA